MALLLDVALTERKGGDICWVKVVDEAEGMGMMMEGELDSTW